MLIIYFVNRKDHGGELLAFQFPTEAGLPSVNLSATLPLDLVAFWGKSQELPPKSAAFGQEENGAVPRLQAQIPRLKCWVWAGTMGRVCRGP